MALVQEAVRPRHSRSHKDNALCLCRASLRERADTSSKQILDIFGRLDAVCLYCCQVRGRSYASTIYICIVVESEGRATNARRCYNNYWISCFCPLLKMYGEFATFKALVNLNLCCFHHVLRLLTPPCHLSCPVGNNLSWTGRKTQMTIW